MKDNTAPARQPSPTTAELMPPIARITPWEDKIVDRNGYDPRSLYVERFWLSVIGPTATWVMRHLAYRFDDAPEGFELDMAHTAATMGLSFKNGFASPFGKSVRRCVMFGLAHPISEGFAVRRKVPSVAHRHLKRLPEDVQREHAHWIANDLGRVA